MINKKSLVNNCFKRFIIAHLPAFFLSQYLTHSIYAVFITTIKSCALNKQK